MTIKLGVPAAEFAAEVATLIVLRAKATGSADIAARAARALEIGAAFGAVANGDAPTAIANLTSAILNPATDPGIALVEGQLIAVGSQALQVELTGLMLQPVISTEVKGLATEVSTGITEVAQLYIPATAAPAAPAPAAP